MYPENHGKKWDMEETNKLMKEIKILNIKEIAKIHKRTENAILLKLIRNAAKLADEDKKLYDLSIITTLNVKTIINDFKKINYNKFEIKPEPEKKSINKYIIGGIIIIIMLPMLFSMGYK